MRGTFEQTGYVFIRKEMPVYLAIIVSSFWREVSAGVILSPSCLNDMIYSPVQRKQNRITLWSDPVKISGVFYECLNPFRLNPDRENSSLKLKETRKPPKGRDEKNLVSGKIGIS